MVVTSLDLEVYIHEATQPRTNVNNILEHSDIKYVIQFYITSNDQLVLVSNLEPSIHLYPKRKLSQKKDIKSE